MQGEPLNPYTDLPWNSKLAPKSTGLLHGQATWNMFANFPWNQVQVLQGTICHQKGPCPVQGD